MTKEDFVLPTLGPKLDAIHADLIFGEQGFARATSGLPVPICDFCPTLGFLAFLSGMLVARVAGRGIRLLRNVPLGLDVTLKCGASLQPPYPALMP